MFVAFQVTDDVYNILKEKYVFECRGKIKIKGKGDMVTYFLMGRKLPTHFQQSASSPSISSHQSNSFRRDLNDSFGSPPQGSQVFDKPGLERNVSGLSLSSHGSGQHREVSRNDSQRSNKQISSLNYPVVVSERQNSLDSNKGLPTPPGSLNRKRYSTNSGDSPRNTVKNTVKKTNNHALPTCISGHISETEYTYGRVDSPELPAVHFVNVKSNNNRPVLNSMFEMLKDGNTANVPQVEDRQVSPNATALSKYRINNNVKSPSTPSKSTRKSKRSSAPVQTTHLIYDSGSRNKNRVMSDIFENNLEEEFGGYQQINNATKVSDMSIPSQLLHRNPSDLSQVSQASSNSATNNIMRQQNSSPQYALARPNRNQMQDNSKHRSMIPVTSKPCQIVNPTVPSIRPTPLVGAGVVPHINGPFRSAPCQQPRKVQNIPSSPFSLMSGYEGDTDMQLHEDVPFENRLLMSNIMKEIGQMNASRDSRRPVIQPQPAKHEPTRQDEQFVTGTYREPLSPQRSHQSPQGRSPLENNFSNSPIHNYVPQKCHTTPPSCSPPPPPLPPKAIQEVRRKSASSRTSSTSSQSTLTSSPALVANIDGKTMSFLPASMEPPPSQPNVGSVIPLRRVPSDITPSHSLDHRTVPQVKRSNSSPKMRYSGFPRNKQENLYPLMHSDDDKESTSSKPMSDHSSVVLLQPIELKLSRPAYVKQLSYPEGGYTRAFLANTDFMVPHIDRNLSRSSDTLSSIPRGPPTPKFPVLSSVGSSSLTQLLKELAAEHPDSNEETSMVSDIHEIPVKKQKQKHNDLSNKTPDHANYNGFTNDDNHIDVHKAEPSENITKHVDVKPIKHKTHVPLFGESAQKPPLQPMRHANPFQVKRRSNNHTSLVRHCRSLDHIPSDRDDYASSNASSAAGSPKSKRAFDDPFSYYSKIEQYLASGRTALGMESLSFSSIASSSEMSKSDPNIHDSGSAAYESEYDNYRPGMTSDEEYFVHEPISDVDLDMFDDINIDNVTVSDSFSMEMPIPRFKKKVTDV